MYYKPEKFMEPSQLGNKFDANKNMVEQRFDRNSNIASFLVIIFEIPTAIVYKRQNQTINYTA